MQVTVETDQLGVLEQVLEEPVVLRELRVQETLHMLADLLAGFRLGRSLHHLQLEMLQQREVREVMLVHRELEEMLVLALEVQILVVLEAQVRQEVQLAHHMQVDLLETI
jgi:hypothetical protein